MLGMPRARLGGISAGVLAACVVFASGASAKPRVVVQRAAPDDPIAVMTHQGGGAVVVGWDMPKITTAAYRQNGTLLWRRVRDQDCGICHGDIRPLRQPDGTFGPMGFTGITTWAYTRTGADAPVCVGLMLGDGSCISGESEPDPAALGQRRQVIVRRGQGQVIWNTPVPGVQMGRGTWNVPPRVVRDREGVAYLTFGGLKDAVTGEQINDRMYAVGVGDGVIRGMYDTGDTVKDDFVPVEPLAGLGSGAVVRAANGGLRAVNPDGSVRWAQASKGGRFPNRAVFDARLRRVVYEVPGGLRQQVVAVRASDGVVLWRTPIAARARLLAVAPNGVVYVGATAGRLRGVWALNPKGARMWRLAVPGEPIVGAMTLRGRLAVATTVKYRARLLYIAPR